VRLVADCYAPFALPCLFVADVKGTVPSLHDADKDVEGQTLDSETDIVAYRPVRILASRSNPNVRSRDGDEHFDPETDRDRNCGLQIMSRPTLWPRDRAEMFGYKIQSPERERDADQTFKRATETTRLQSSIAKLHYSQGPL